MGHNALVLRNGTWRVPSFGQLTDFDPGFGQDPGATTLSANVDPSFVPDPIPTVDMLLRAPVARPDAIFGQFDPFNGDDDDGGDGLVDAETLDFTPKFWIIGGVGLLAIVGIGAAVALSGDKPKRKRRNPLAAGHSQKTVSKNVRKLKREGYGNAQACAIALRSARSAYRKRYPRKALPRHLKRKSA